MRRLSLDISGKVIGQFPFSEEDRSRTGKRQKCLLISGVVICNICYRQSPALVIKVGDWERVDDCPATKTTNQRILDDIKECYHCPVHRENSPEDEEKWTY